MVRCPTSRDIGSNHVRHTHKLQLSSRTRTPRTPALGQCPIATHHAHPGAKTCRVPVLVLDIEGPFKGVAPAQCPDQQRFADGIQSAFAAGRRGQLQLQQGTTPQGWRGLAVAGAGGSIRLWASSGTPFCRILPSVCCKGRRNSCRSSPNPGVGTQWNKAQ